MSVPAAVLADQIVTRLAAYTPRAGVGWCYYCGGNMNPHPMYGRESGHRDDCLHILAITIREMRGADP